MEKCTKALWLADKAYGVAQEYIAIKAKREGITRQEAIEKILALRE